MKLKFIFKIGLIYIIYLAFAIIFHGCGCTNYYSLNGIYSLEAYELHGLSYERIDTVGGPFVLNAEMELEYLSYWYDDIDIIQNAYAFSCEEIVVNPLNEKSLSLTANKAFVFEADTIFPGSPFENLKGIDPRIYLYEMQVSFSQDFFDKSQFDNTNYTFKLSIMNFDTIPELFSDSISLYMNIQ